MARIAGINIPPHKHTEIGLTSIYGVGRTTAQKICTNSGVPFDRKVKDLTDTDLEKILHHYGYTFDDVVVENVYTTNMTDFINVSGFRNSIYKKQFPTGTWLEVKGLAVQGQLIEIDMEAHKVKK